MLPARVPVLVVGGGPAGAAVAWHAAQAGLDVCLIDRAHFPRAKPCAEYLSPEGVRQLEVMGVRDALAPESVSTIVGMGVFAPSGARIRGEFAGRGALARADAGVVPPSGIGVRREVLDTALLHHARAAGVQVVEGVHLEQLCTDGRGRVTGATVRTVDGVRTIHAECIVAADGLRSVVARRLQLAHHARWPRRVALVTHMRGVEGIAAHGEMHVRRDGYVGLAPVGGDVVNVALVVPRRDAAAMAGDAAGFLDAWIARDAGLAPRFAAAQRVAPVRATGPFGARARRVAVDGAFLTGDAADFFDPFTGEGITAALRGGALLAPFLADCLRASGPDSRARVRDAYGAARRALFIDKWRVERLLGVAVSMPALLDRAARVLARDRELADLFVGVAGQVVPPSAVLRPRTLLRLFT
ncbi:MAG: FAD-dependent monooxygenase [Gemmatimonadetes bacterium]|nr:FAD-dependent monooxygenase [Gemmatimonadota bacterium]